MRGWQRPVLLRRDMDPLELLEVGDVEAVGAEHGEDHGQEGEAVEEAEYDAEERHLRKERSYWIIGGTVDGWMVYISLVTLRVSHQNLAGLRMNAHFTSDSQQTLKKTR